MIWTEAPDPAVALMPSAQEVRISQTLGSITTAHLLVPEEFFIAPD